MGRMLRAPSFQGPRSPLVSFSCLGVFFVACRFFPQGRMQDLPNGGGGGGGADPSIGPRALETLGTPLLSGLLQFGNSLSNSDPVIPKRKKEMTDRESAVRNTVQNKTYPPHNNNNTTNNVVVLVVCCKELKRDSLPKRSKE